MRRLMKEMRLIMSNRTTDEVFADHLRLRREVTSRRISLAITRRMSSC